MASPQNDVAMAGTDGGTGSAESRPDTVVLHDLITTLSTDFINLPAEEIDREIQNALRRIGGFAGVDRAYVFLVNAALGTMSNTHEWCREGIVPQRGNLQNVPVESYAWCMSHILSSEILHIPRVADLPDTFTDKSLLLGEGIQSLLAVPMTSGGRVIGLVGFDAVRHERDWPPEMVTLLKIVGTIFGNAMERKRFDEALRKEKEFIANVVETAGSLVMVLAPDGRCLRANRAASEITGLSAAELVEKGWHQVIPVASRDSARQALRHAIAGQPVRFEGLILAASGEERIILWNGAVARSRDGKPDYVVVTGTDLTETRRLREQVEQARRLDSLGRVAATIAHEFNNVLMIISPQAQMISKHPERLDAVQSAAERIERAVRRGERITQEVTRFARPAEPALQSIQVGEWTEALVDEMRAAVADRHPYPITIHTKIASSQATVLGDPHQLHQVLSNLILNAADAIPRGGEITVIVEGVDRHDYLPAIDTVRERWVHWAVCDTGKGIAPAVLDRIFEPLFTTKRQGTGLGLAVAHQIVKAHGGSVSVETLVGRGTTFHVFLPAPTNA